MVARARGCWNDIDFPQNFGVVVGNLFPVASDFDGFGFGQVTVRGKSRRGFRGRRLESVVARFLDGDSPADNFCRLRVVGGAVRVEFGQSVGGSGVAFVA